MQDGLEGIFKCFFVDEESTNKQDMPTNRGKTTNQVVVPLFYSYSKLLNTLTKPQQNIIRKTLKKNLNCKRSRLVCGWRPRCKERRSCIPGNSNSLTLSS